MLNYHPAFLGGMGVRIADKQVLQQFLTPHLPFPLTAVQLGYAGRQSSIVDTSFYHGGLVLHTLKDIPGIWDEECLLDAMFDASGFPAYPRPNDYFVIEKMNTEHGQYVVITDQMGVECLKLRCPSSDVEREAIRQVASKLHMLTFERRYGFLGTFLPNQADARNCTG